MLKKWTRKNMRFAATLGVASALVVGGVAVAQGDSQQGASPKGSPSSQKPGGHPGGPPPFGPPLKGLTYAEFHVLKDGQAETIRLDQGKIVAVSESSITLSENDGSEVTIALDEETEILAGPGRNSTVDDLSVGQQVSVCGPEGEAAKAVMVPPKRGEMKGRPESGEMPPPPPGAQMGS